MWCAPVAPEHTTPQDWPRTSAGTAAFSCVNCGAPTDWTPRGLRCSSCGRVAPVEPLPDKVRRRPLRPVFADDAAWELERPDDLVLQLQCPNCGGGASYGGTLRSSYCPFCAAPVALKDVHEAGGRLPIDGVIPFQIDDREAHRAIRRWLARAYFAPRGVRTHTKATHYARLYLPVLSVDADLLVDYVSSGSLHGDYGEVTGRVLDIVVSASSAVDQKYLDRFRPWPLHLVVPYRPEYLAGAVCESYDHELATIRELIHNGLRSRGADMARAALRAERTWGGDTPSLESWNCRSSAEGYRHLLFPVYLVTTRLDDQVTQVVVNGIDGTIASQTPISPWKVGVPIAVVAAIGLAVPWLTDAFG